MSEAIEHLTCREVVELVSDYLESALPVEEAELFEQHLNFCDGCATYLEQMRATLRIVGRLREGDVPDATREKLMTAFRDWRRS